MQSNLFVSHYLIKQIISFSGPVGNSLTCHPDNPVLNMVLEIKSDLNHHLNGSPWSFDHIPNGRLKNLGDVDKGSSPIICILNL